MFSVRELGCGNALQHANIFFHYALSGHDCREYDEQRIQYGVKFYKRLSQSDALI